MALGNGGYNNSSSDLDITYYSRVRFMNNDGKLSLSFSFWKGTLKISISDRTVQNVKDSEIVSVIISPFKAKAFVECIDKILINDLNNAGIPEIWGIDGGSVQSGIRSTLAIGNSEEGIFLYINKINENRDYDVKQRFVFRSGANNIFKFSDLENGVCVEENMDRITLEILRDLFDDFARGASGAFAVGHLDLQRYEISRLTRFLNSVSNSLNIYPYRDLGGNSNVNNRQGNGSFFRNNNNNGSNNNSGNNNTGRRQAYTNIDDLESELN